MKLFLCLAMLYSVCSFGQSIDGNGTSEIIVPSEIGESQMAEEIGMLSYEGEKSKFKKGKLVRSFQWFDYEDEDSTVFRFRREYDAELFLYDELFLFTPDDSMETRGIYTTRGMIRHDKNSFEFEEVEEGGVFTPQGPFKVYDEGVLQSTIYFDDGRPSKLYINHYYENGQLQFVREITSKGLSEPFLNTGVLEAYYPNGDRFENPINEEGSAIILLDEDGVEYDQCQCMDQDIMEWGQSFLYSYLGKYYFLLESIYSDEGMECCWE